MPTLTSWHAGTFGGALEVAAVLHEGWPDRWARLSDSLGLDEIELARWRTIAETMVTGWNSQTGLFEQFAGFFSLQEIDYYEPLCGHGSSLSGAMHGLVAARLGYSDLALRYFEQAVAIDLADNHTTIAGGLHMAALGGTWLTAYSVLQACLCGATGFPSIQSYRQVGKP